MAGLSDAEPGFEKEATSQNMTNELVQDFLMQRQKDCVENHISGNISSNETQGKFCPRIFDGWNCWNRTPAGTVSFAPCPYWIPGFISTNLNDRKLKLVPLRAPVEDERDSSTSTSKEIVNEGKGKVELVTETLNTIINYFTPDEALIADRNQNISGFQDSSLIEILTQGSDHNLEGNRPELFKRETLEPLSEPLVNTVKSTQSVSLPTTQSSGRLLARKSSSKALSPFQRKPTEDQVLTYMKIYGKVFGYLRAKDIIAARQVCRNWYTFSTSALRRTTAFVFNAHDDLANESTAALLKPWLLFTASVHNRSQFVEYIQTSLNKLSIWSTLRIRNANTEDLKLILTSWNEAFLCDLFKNVTTLEVSGCLVDWETLFQFLSHFKGLETFQDYRNCYFEAIPLHVQLIQGLTGGEESPRSRNMEIGQEFIRDFRKYSVMLKNLKVEDKGLGMNTGILLALLREALPPNSLEEIEVLPGPEIVQDSEKNTKEITMLWISVAELLLHSRDSLRKLTVRSTNDKAPRKSFENFVHSCIEYFNKAKGDFELSSLRHLTLDFNFLWLSSEAAERELIPFILNLEELESLSLKTIVMRPISDERLQLLTPLLPNCFYDFGLHLTDLEGTEVTPQVTILMENPLYQVMRSLSISVHTRHTVELRTFWSENDDVTFPNLTSLNVTLMNPHFRTLNLENFTRKFSGLTELCIVDGPTLECIGSHMTVRPEKMCSLMSQVKLGNNEFQLIMETYPTLRHLTLQLNMEAVTDSGVTGIHQVSINQMIRQKDMLLQDEPEYEITGYAISEMAYLETLVLRGLGEWVTDISVLFGFQKAPRLKNLVLYGRQRVSRNVREQLYTSFPKSRGYGVKIVT